MRIVTYIRGCQDRLGVLLNDQVLDLQVLAQRAGVAAPFFSCMSSFLEAGDASLTLAHRMVEQARAVDLVRIPEAQALARVHLRAPVTRPGKIIALGWNYRDHAAEQKVEPPTTPLIFSKFPNSIAGPYDPIVIPHEDPQVDYEVELGVVIGRRGKRIREDHALDYVAGYLVINDVSARQWQFSDKQWTRAKSCDTFTPSGPWLTMRNEISDPHNLNLETRVNGEIRQHSNTGNMIFRIPAVLAFVSANITLAPGDIIATGTPPGVGLFRNPPIFLAPGDVVETEIEGLGCLRNSVIMENGLSS